MADQSREVRFNALAPIELRDDGGESGEIRVQGYAAVFGELTDIGPVPGWGWRETIAPGAFSEALKRGDDASFLINHEGLPLARVSSGTLILAEDNRGLSVSTKLDAGDPDVQRILPKMKRGDLTKMSFAFRKTIDEWDETGDVPLRTIKEVELFDVSIVTDPAYLGTDIGVRSRDAALASQGYAGTVRVKMQMRSRLSGAI
jgi:HK97 family phage prohead protease